MKGTTFILFLGCLFAIGNAAATAPKKVIAGPDDTVYGIAYNYGIPTRTLIAANNLKPPYTLNKGQELIIPSPNEHRVGAGETLQDIAENYGVNVDVLAQENDIASPSHVKPGDSLSIPSHDTESLTEALKPPSQEITTSSLAPLPLVKSVAAPAKSDQPTASSHQSSSSQPTEGVGLPDDLAEELAQEKGIKNAGKSAVDSSDKPMLMGNLTQGNAGAPITPSEPIQETKQEVQKEEKKPKKSIEKEEKKETKKTEAAPKETLFIWPVEGTVITKFGKGGKNDGINIKVPQGTPVKAAAGGKVMYAGNELKGFGNLILIKHKDGWMTAYAHNSELLVKKGDTVKQGQPIANSGHTGDVKEPQLHFEIRKGKQPVDPLPKLES